MNCVQTYTLQLGGNGHDSPEPFAYYMEDIEELYARGATSGRLGNVINLTATLNGTHEVVALFGLTSVGAEMGYAALPCPPYCEKKREVRYARMPPPTIFTTSVAKHEISFKEALAYLKVGKWPKSKP